MARALTGLFAGAAVAFTAAALAAHAQPAPAAEEAGRAAAQAERDAGPGDVRVMRRQLKADDKAAKSSDREVRREERRIIIRDGDHEMTMMGHGHDMGMEMGEHLRTMLQLKPGQEGALQAYLAAVRPQHRDHEHMEMSRAEGPKTTPERLADLEKRMADSQAQAHARIEATRRFYAQLEPSQKKVFDEMPMLMMGPVGPIGPMVMPMRIRFEHPPMPPMPPAPPVPPAPPRL